MSENNPSVAAIYNHIIEAVRIRAITHTRECMRRFDDIGVPAIESKTIHINLGRQVGHTSAAMMLLKTHDNSLIFYPTQNRASDRKREYPHIKDRILSPIHSSVNKIRAKYEDRLDFIVLDEFLYGDRLLEETIHQYRDKTDLFILLGCYP